MTSSDPRITQRAEELYVARCLEREAVANTGRLSFAEMYNFLTDPSVLLTQVQQRLLFTDARLRSDFRLLRHDLAQSASANNAAYLTMPRLAAAGDRSLDERRFPGGLAKIAPSEVDARQIYVVLELDDPSTAPRGLILQSPSGEVAKLRLEAPDDDGVIQMLLDTTQPENDLIVRLLRDPNSDGIFC